jgi:hypothetical protein
MTAPSALRNPYALVPALCLIVYCLHAQEAPTNYFRELAENFLQGRLHIAAPSNTHDLVHFGGRYYLYWPPVPALLFMPLVALFGSGVSDNLVTSLFGTANVWLFMQACRQLSARFMLGLQRREITALGIFWGLGTVHFYMSSKGDVWLISQVIAQTMLLASVVAFLARKPLLLSGLFFALAVYTRNDLVFAAIFFFALHRAILSQRRGGRMIGDGLLFILPFLVCSMLNAWYNWTRFGDAFENGLQYHVMSHHFAENFHRHGYFSLHYLPHNLYTEVFHAPTLIPRPPFILDEPEGFGFLWASPLFFWLAPAVALWIYRIVRQRRGVPGSQQWLAGGSIAAALPIAATIFLIMGTGWVQFAARYTLDFQVFLLFFLLASWPRLRALPGARRVSVVLIVLSVAIQAVGAGHYHWW